MTVTLPPFSRMASMHFIGPVQPAARREELSSWMVMRTLFMAWLIDLAVVDEADGAAFDEGFEEFAFEGEVADEVIEGDEGDGADDAAGDGVVAAVHGVLDGVGEDEEEDEVEGSELADLAFSGESEEDEDEDVDDGAAEDEVPPGEEGSAWFANRWG